MGLIWKDAGFEVSNVVEEKQIVNLGLLINGCGEGPINHAGTWVANDLGPLRGRLYSKPLCDKHGYYVKRKGEQAWVIVELKAERHGINRYGTQVVVAIFEHDDRVAVSR
jgi:hypothetical protein